MPFTHDEEQANEQQNRITMKRRNNFTYIVTIIISLSVIIGCLLWFFNR